MTTRRLTFAVSIGGILWFVFMLTIPDFMAVPGFAPFQPDPNRQGWLNRILEGLYKWVYRVLCGLRSSLPRKKRMAILNAANRRNPRARALINWIWAFSPSATALLVR